MMLTLSAIRINTGTELFWVLDRFVYIMHDIFVIIMNPISLSYTLF